MAKGVTFDVVGLDHRLIKDTQRVLKKLVQVSPLTCQLQREPGNLYDKNAIKVIVNDERLRENYPKVFGSNKLHIGYLRRDVAKVLAPGFDKRRTKARSCNLTQVNVSHGWGRVSIVFSKKRSTKPEIAP
jgi:hypothetical protein